MNKVVSFFAVIGVLLMASPSGSANSSDEASNAAAIETLTGVTLQCRVQLQGSAYLPPYQTNYCVAAQAGSTYNVWYQVFAPAGSQYSYQWQVPAATGQSISSGCTATTSYCTLQVTSAGRDRTNTIGVVVTDSSGSVSDMATYEIPAVCGGGGFPYVFC